MSMRQVIGGQTGGGVDALFTPGPFEEAQDGEVEGHRSVEAAWGFPALGGRYTGSPHAELGLSDTSRDYKLGWRLIPEDNAPDVSLGINTTNRRSRGSAAEQSVGLEINASW